MGPTTERSCLVGVTPGVGLGATLPPSTPFCPHSSKNYGNSVLVTNKEGRRQKCRENALGKPRRSNSKNQGICTLPPKSSQRKQVDTDEAEEWMPIFSSKEELKDKPLIEGIGHKWSKNQLTEGLWQRFLCCFLTGQIRTNREGG